MLEGVLKLVINKSTKRISSDRSGIPLEAEIGNAAARTLSRRAGNGKTPSRRNKFRWKSGLRIARFGTIFDGEVVQ
jgi:hypothetical protein